MIRRARTLAATGLLLASPALAQTQKGPPPPPPLAATFLNGPATPAAVASDPHWWTGFHDPVLSQLVDQALAQNIDVQIGMARIDAARATARGARAAGRPELDIGANAGRQRLSGYAIGFDDAAEQNVFEGGLAASWEIDLFGRVHSGVVAARADIAASQADLKGIRLAVSNQVAHAYLAVRGAEQRAAIVAEQADAQDRTAAFTRNLVDAGSAPRADLDRALTQAASSRADLPALKLERQLQVERLALLLAVPSSQVEAILARQSLPQATVDPGAGVPADLLRRRPDVAAAEERVLAAYGRLGVARADLKPRLTLGGMIGALVDSFSGIGFSRSIEYLAQAAVSAPLFDGGRRRSAVDQRKAEAEEARLLYQATVLGAVRDVEAALASLREDRERAALLQTAADNARRASEQVHNAWRAGQSPILDVLEADRSRLTAEDALLAARTSVLGDQAQLYAALGE